MSTAVFTQLAVLLDGSDFILESISLTAIPLYSVHSQLTVSYGVLGETVDASYWRSLVCSTTTVQPVISITHTIYRWKLSQQPISHFDCPSPSKCADLQFTNQTKNQLLQVNYSVGMCYQLRPFCQLWTDWQISVLPPRRIDNVRWQHATTDEYTLPNNILCQAFSQEVAFGGVP